MKPFRNPSLLSALFLSPVLLSGCAQNTVLTAKVCDAWGQIVISKADVLTDGTASQIEKNNVGREALGCKYEAPPKSKASTPSPKTS